MSSSVQGSALDFEFIVPKAKIYKINPTIYAYILKKAQLFWQVT